MDRRIQMCRRRRFEGAFRVSMFPIKRYSCWSSRLVYCRNWLTISVQHSHLSTHPCWRICSPFFPGIYLLKLLLVFWRHFLRFSDTSLFPILIPNYLRKHGHWYVVCSRSVLRKYKGQWPKCGGESWGGWKLAHERRPYGCWLRMQHWWKMRALG